MGAPKPLLPTLGGRGRRGDQGLWVSNRTGLMWSCGAGGGDGVDWRRERSAASCSSSVVIRRWRRRVAGRRTGVHAVDAGVLACWRGCRGAACRRGRPPSALGGHRSPEGCGPPGRWAAPGVLGCGGGGSSVHHPGKIERGAAPRAWSSGTSVGWPLYGWLGCHGTSGGAGQGWRGPCVGGCWKRVWT